MAGVGNVHHSMYSKGVNIQQYWLYNIDTVIHYSPLHVMPFYQQHARGTLNNTEKSMNKIMTLPIGSSIRLDDARYVVGHLTKLFINSCFNEVRHERI